MTFPTEFLAHVAEVLDRLGIEYHVGGSVASTVHGIYRTSADADLVIDPTPEQLEALIVALEPDYYVSRSAAMEALAQRGTFNAIHPDTTFKLDFFLKGPGAFDAEEQRRSIHHPLSAAGGRTIRLKSAEDTVLRKLDWYRRGGEASERQWRDVVAVLVTMRGRLDEAHLDRWAAELGVSDLLERARAQATAL